MQPFSHNYQLNLIPPTGMSKVQATHILHVFLRKLNNVSTSIEKQLYP